MYRGQSDKDVCMHVKHFHPTMQYMTEAVVEKQLQRQQNQLQRQHINNEDAPDTLWIIHMQIFFRRHLCTARLNYLET